MIKKHIFISHAWSDQHLVKGAIQKLQKGGYVENEDFATIDCPNNFDKGESIRHQIKESINNCDIVYLLWSKDAAKSPWVQYEVGMAQALDRPIVIVQTGNTAPELPIEMKQNQVVKLNAKGAK